MINDYDLFIIAAGKGSRLNEAKPKALLEINGISNVERTIKLAFRHFRHIYVVISKEDEHKWPDQIVGARYITIESGLGDGHALKEALNHAFATDRICVVWGDAVFQSDESFKQMLESDIHFMYTRGIVGVIEEDNPYVNIKTKNDIVTHAEFSKFGENSEKGLHDQSIFVFDTKELYIALQNLHDASFRNGKYNFVGYELSLLHTFHYFYNVEKGFNGIRPIKLSEKTMSYNTPEELEAIRIYFSEKE